MLYKRGKLTGIVQYQGCEYRKSTGLKTKTITAYRSGCTAQACNGELQELETIRLFDLIRLFLIIKKRGFLILIGIHHAAV